MRDNEGDDWRQTAMVFFDGALGLIFLGLWIFCIIDAITTPPQACRHLPKLAWVVLVVVLGDVGSIVWLVVGRPRAGIAGPGERGAVSPPATRGPTARPTSPDDDEEFLARLRARAEEQRRRHDGDGPDGHAGPGTPG